MPSFPGSALGTELNRDGSDAPASGPFWLSTNGFSQTADQGPCGLVSGVWSVNVLSPRGILVSSLRGCSGSRFECVCSCIRVREVSRRIRVSFVVSLSWSFYDRCFPKALPAASSAQAQTATAQLSRSSVAEVRHRNSLSPSPHLGVDPCDHHRSALLHGVGQPQTCW